MIRLRKAPWRSDVQPSRLSWRDLIYEATAGLTQRPGRSALTMLGTVLGVGAFVAVLGLTATTSSQISSQFNVLTATTVTIDVADSESSNPDKTTEPRDAFPPDADQRITRLNGALAAGVWRPVRFNGNPTIGASPATLPGSVADIGTATTVYAASPGAIDAAQPTVAQGLTYNDFHEKRAESVAVLGIRVAERLGIAQLDSRPAVFINQRAFTVIGIVADTKQLPELLSGIMIPRGTANDVYGPPADGTQGRMIIRTKIGAAKLIANQAPVALRPENPGLYAAVPPPDPRKLRENVADDLAGLFLLLAAICLVIGTVGIANITFVAVLERTGEIGLRRSLGATPRHIATQFLTESTTLGLLGGMIGTTLAVMTVLAVSIAKQWTAVLDPITVLPAPFIGAATGLLAGLYPALRATRIEPQQALR